MPGPVLEDYRLKYCRKIATTSGGLMVERHWAVPDAQAATVLAPTMYSADPVAGATGACVKVLEDNIRRPGKNYIVAWFRPLTMLEWMISSAPMAIGSGGVSLRTQKLLVTTDSHIVEGQDPSDATGMTLWKPSGGSNSMITPQGTISIHGVVPSTNTVLGELAAGVGCYNSATMTNFPGGGTTNTILCTSLRFEALQVGWGHFYQFRAGFLRHPTSWVPVCVSQKYQQRAMEVPLYDPSGTDTGRKSHVIRLVPASGTGSTLTVTRTGSSTFAYTNGIITTW